MDTMGYQLDEGWGTGRCPTTTAASPSASTVGRGRRRNPPLGRSKEPTMTSFVTSFGVALIVGPIARIELNRCAVESESWYEIGHGRKPQRQVGRAEQDQCVTHHE